MNLRHRAVRGAVRRSVAFLAATGAVACGGGEERAVGTAPDVFPEGVGQVIVGMSNWLTRDGVRSAFLRADTAYTYEEAGRLDLRGVTLTFFGEAGDTTGVLTGREAEYMIEAQDVTVRGDVRIDLATGERFESQLLVYIAAAGQIRADSGYVRTLADGTVDQGTYVVHDLATEETRYGSGSTTTPEVTVPQ